MNNEEEIVTLETYYDRMLAEIMRAKLEANDIPCLLADENMGSIYPMYNQGGGGIKLKVLEHDLEKGREILNQTLDTFPDEETDDNDI